VGPRTRIVHLNQLRARRGRSQPELLQLVCLLDVTAVQAALVTSPATRFSVLRLHGGADSGGDDVEDLEEDAALDSSASEDEDALENPFLGAAAGDASGPLNDVARALQDPSQLQDALKELQDPAAQERMKAMMEDPEFQQSMHQYIDELNKDPQFQQLRAQMEQQMKDPAFVEQISKAFAGLEGGLGGEPPKGESDPE